MNLDTIVFGNITLGHILFPILFGICGVIAMNLPYWKPKKSEQTCQATIKSKRVEYSNTPQIYYRGNRWNYLVTFECEDGTTVELHTTESAYGQLKEEMIGKLTYQNDNLISFE
ncbi:MAG: DUF2500 family protein [Agathobacter sp.]|nr:DUF2500 family protein [Agathobacter sp.]